MNSKSTDVQNASDEYTVLVVNPKAFTWTLVYNIEEMLKREGLPAIRHGFKKLHYSMLIQAPDAVKRVRDLIEGFDIVHPRNVELQRLYPNCLSPKMVQVCRNRISARRELKLRFPDHV